MPTFKTTTTKPTYIEYEINARNEEHANELLEQYIKAGDTYFSNQWYLRDSTYYVVPTGYSFTGDETIQPEDMEQE